MLQVIEPMGHEVVAYFDAGDTRLVARLAPQELPKLGAEVALVADLERLHLFDTESGETLSIR